MPYRASVARPGWCRRAARVSLVSSSPAGVVTAQIVRRVLAINGLDRLVSIYPSLEAATAGRPLAPVPALAADGAGTNGPAPPRRPGGPTARFPSADGNRAAVTGAVVWHLVNALQDGVALADDNGAVALANTRLEQMFGYQHAELLGQPIEVLLPVDLEAAPGSHRARHALAPRTRLTGAGAGLVGLRKDGTTFPAEISLNSVMTAAGHFAVIVIRDVTQTRRAGELADLAAAAVAAEQAHRSQEVLDTTITSLFHVGLSLQAAIDIPAELIRPSSSVPSPTPTMPACWPKKSTRPPVSCPATSPRPSATSGSSTPPGPSPSPGGGRQPAPAAYRPRPGLSASAAGFRARPCCPTSPACQGSCVLRGTGPPPPSAAGGRATSHSCC